MQACPAWKIQCVSTPVNDFAIIKLRQVVSEPLGFLEKNMSSSGKI